MKRPVLILLLFSLLCTVSEQGARAQQLWKLRRYEALVGLGPSFFFGDIGGFSRGENILGFKDFTFLQTRANFNFSAKYRILEDINIRLSITSATLKATDTRGSNENRNMVSAISIFEPAILGEFYFIKNTSERSYFFSKGQGGRGFMSSLDFYAFTGLGGASFSVKPNTELQDSPALKDGGFTPVIPLGVGMTLVYSADINFGIEIGGRYSFSDYIDGYTSQYSSANDVYYFLNFTFAYKLRTGRNGGPILW